MRTGGGGSGSPPAGRPGDDGGGPRGRHRPAPRHGRFALRRRSAPPLRAARVRRSPAPSRRRRLGPRRVQLSARRRAATLPALGRRPGPGAVFADRELAGAFAGLLLLAAVLTGFLVSLVQYLQNVQGLDALRSGLAILPFGVALLLTTQGLTRFVSTVDLRIRAMGGLVVVLAGVAWLTLLDGDSTYAAGVLPQIVLIGTGVGVAIVPFNTVILATAPAEHAGITAGVLQTALTIGGSVGLALLLIPFAGAGQGAADTISSVFVWASLTTVAAILVPLVLWFGPGAAKGRAPAA
ncbi:MFS transporter [Streptomyces sp. For3]|uniref:MFS transporter n=1 Tax=Streptomyces silvae TaxID=2803812 RepID=UPI0019205B31|nr:MFS transporter [Streptomyces silvae]MBL1287908.1 MFS transporter [Streptomyces silvae]